LSGGRFFTIPDSEAGDFASGRVLSDEDIARLSRIDQYLRGKDRALRALALRPRSKKEISDLLDRLDLERAVSEGIISELTEAGFIDDRRFARDFVRAKAELKGWGPHRLDFRLRELGIARRIIEEVLAERFTRETQQEMAWALARKKLGSSPPDERAVKRVSDMLKRRGFDFEVINGVVFELLRECRSRGEEED